MRSDYIIDWAVQTGLSVTSLIVFILLIRRPFAKRFGAKAAYALWLLPVLRLFIPTITVPRVFPETAVTGLPEVTAVLSPIVTPHMIDEATKSSWPDHLLPMALGLWVIGAVGFFLYHWLRQAAFMDEALSNSQPAQGLKSVIESAAFRVGLNQIPQVKISDDNRGPFVSGLFRPIVILPNDFTQSFSAQQQSYALIHEFMHIKRGDLFMTGFGLVFRSLNWPNPIIHYAAKHFRSDQEAACDASALKVMGGGTQTLTAYAETLVHAAKAAAQKSSEIGRASPQPSALTLTIHHPLKERLMILGTHTKKSNWRSRAAATVLIVGAATLSAPIIQATNHPDEVLAGEPKLSFHPESTIRLRSHKDGDETSKNYDIEINGDEVKAFEIDNEGRKTQIDPGQIKDFDLQHLINSKVFSFGMRQNLKFLDEDGLEEWIEKTVKENTQNILKFGSGNDNFLIAKNDFFDGNIEVMSDVITSFTHDDAFKKLEKQKFLHDENLHMTVRMQSAESMLQAAEELIEQSEEYGPSSQDNSKAKRELEKARKALKAAQRALKEAN